MTLIVEDGTGLANSNTYVDEAYVLAYLQLRGRDTPWTAGGGPAQQAACVAATDYIETRFAMRFLSTKLNAGANGGTLQALSFPRVNLYSRDGVLIGGVPANLKKAAAEYASRALTIILLPDPVTDPTARAVVGSEQTVGPISTKTQYQSGAGMTTMIKPYPAADMLLQEFLGTLGAVR